MRHAKEIDLGKGIPASKNRIQVMAAYLKDQGSTFLSVISEVWVGEACIVNANITKAFGISLAIHSHVSRYSESLLRTEDIKSVLLDSDAILVDFDRFPEVRRIVVPAL